MATNKTVALTTWTSQQSAQSTLQTIQSALIDRNFSSGGLTIGSSSKKALKLANTVYTFSNGVLKKTTTAEYAVSGTVTNAKFNVFVVYTTGSTPVTAMGTEGATLADVVFPTLPANAAVIGFAIVNPTGTGNFVGATTDFDDATVVPNAVYIDTVGVFNPNMLTL